MAQAPEAADDMVSSDPLTLLELREAVELQGAQRTGEAIEVLERILAREPGNPDALHLLGMALVWLVVLLSAERLQRVLGDAVMTAFERLMGLILTAIAIEMLLAGIRAYIASL